MELRRNDQSRTSYAILDLVQETISLDLAPGKDCDFVWSAKMIALISTISVFEHCFQPRAGFVFQNEAPLHLFIALLCWHLLRKVGLC